MDIFKKKSTMELAVARYFIEGNVSLSFQGEMGKEKQGISQLRRIYET